MGLRAGKGAAASAYRRGADVWKALRAGPAAKLVVLSARAPEDSTLDAILPVDDAWLWRVEIGRLTYFAWTNGSFWELGRHCTSLPRQSSGAGWPMAMDKHKSWSRAFSQGWLTTVRRKVYGFIKCNPQMHKQEKPLQNKFRNPHARKQLF